MSINTTESALSGALLIFVIVAGLYLFINLYRRFSADKGATKLSNYKYYGKEYIMTNAEMQCFRRLEHIADSKYYVFPQIHLSSLLDHQVKNGQDWRAALAKIQRKSVDFVLVDKNTLKTVYAIELDDSTHDKHQSRIDRDLLVNEILLDSGIALVRLRNIQNVSDESLIEQIKAAKVYPD